MRTLAALCMIRPSTMNRLSRPPPAAPQFLEEFMSTRLGVKRTAEVVNAEERTGADGQLYYDIATRVSGTTSPPLRSPAQGQGRAALAATSWRYYKIVTRRCCCC